MLGLGNEIPKHNVPLGGAFDPAANLSGLIHWYDTTEGTTISGGSKCYEWTDRMGTLNLSSLPTSGAVYTASDADFGGLPSNNLGASNLAGTGGPAIPLPLTVCGFMKVSYSSNFEYFWRNVGGAIGDNFRVHKRTVSNAAGHIYGGQNENINANPNGINWNPKTGALLASGDGGTDVHFLEFFCSPTAAIFKRDGVFADGALSGKTNTLGMDGTLLMGNGYIKVGDVFIVNRELNDADRNNLITWGNSKYNLSIPTL